MSIDNILCLLGLYSAAAAVAGALLAHLHHVESKPAPAPHRLAGVDVPRFIKLYQDRKIA